MALIVANTVPLVGALVFGWSVYALVMIYWLENGIIGVYTIVKILCAKDIGPVGNTRPYKVLLFCAHYGTFWMVHGSLLASFVFPHAQSLPVLSPLFLPSLFGLAISHGVSLRANYFGLKENAKVSALKQMFVPYARVLPASALLFMLALVAANFDMSGAAILSATALLKTIADAAAHRAQHHIISAMPAPTSNQPDTRPSATDDVQ